MDKSIYSLLMVTLLFFIISNIAVYLINHTTLTKRFVDTPDARKIHQLQIPRIGGFAFILSYLAIFGVIFLITGNSEGSLFSLLYGSALAKAIFWGAFVIFGIGFFDDSTFVEVNVPVKFAAQFAAGAIVVFLFNIQIDTVHFFGYTLELGTFGTVLSLFWIVGVINSFNIIDGIDGLSSSLALISLFIASIVFWVTGERELLYVTFPLMGVIGGFLVHNYPPAKLFAGDSGSLFFGLAVSVISIKIGMLTQTDGVHVGKPVETIAVFMVVALPVIEVLISMMRRYWYGVLDKKSVGECLKRMVKPDNLHMHHRLIFRGLNHEQALKFLVFFSFSISLTTLLFVLSDSLYIKIASLVYSIYIVAMVVKRLEYGKGALHYEEASDDVAVRKTIAITGGNEYFENSMRYFTEKRYWIASINSISEVKNRYIELFIIYNNDEEHIDDDIAIAKSIRERFKQTIFFITDVKSKKLNSIDNLYRVKKPVDIPYLIHDIERVSHKRFKGERKRNLEGTLAIEKWEE